MSSSVNPEFDICFCSLWVSVSNHNHFTYASSFAFGIETLISRFFLLGLVAKLFSTVCRSTFLILFNVWFFVCCYSCHAFKCILALCSQAMFCPQPPQPQLVGHQSLVIPCDEHTFLLLLVQEGLWYLLHGFYFSFLFFPVCWPLGVFCLEHVGCHVGIIFQQWRARSKFSPGLLHARFTVVLQSFRFKKKWQCCGSRPWKIQFPHLTIMALPLYFCLIEKNIRTHNSVDGFTSWVPGDLSLPPGYWWRAHCHWIFCWLHHCSTVCCYPMSVCL